MKYNINFLLYACVSRHFFSQLIIFGCEQLWKSVDYLDDNRISFICFGFFFHIIDVINFI